MRVTRKEIPPAPVAKQYEYVITLSETEARELKQYLSDKPVEPLTWRIFACLPG